MIRKEQIFKFFEHVRFCFCSFFTLLFSLVMTLVKQEALKSLQKYAPSSVHQRTSFFDDPIYLLEGHKNAINELHFSPNGKILASCADEIIIWKVDTKVESIGALKPHNSGITSLSWHVDSTKLVSSSADKTLCVQDIPTGSILRRIRDHEDIVNTVQFMHEDPNIILSGDDSNYIMVHDMRTKELIIKYRSNSPVLSISVNGKSILVGGVDGDLYLNSLLIPEKKLKNNIRIKGDNIIFGTTFKPDGMRSAAITTDSMIRIYDNRFSCPDEQRLLSSIKFAQQQLEVIPTRIIWSDDGNWISSGSTDKMVRIWNVENERNPILRYELPGHEGTVTCVDFLPNNPKIIASCGTDGKIIVGELSE